MDLLCFGDVWQCIGNTAQVNKKNGIHEISVNSGKKCDKVSKETEAEKRLASTRECCCVCKEDGVCNHDEPDLMIQVR